MGCVWHRDFAASTVSGSQAAPESEGILIVYTAPDPHAHFNGSPYNIRYSDYTICSAGGAVFGAVENNNSGTMVEGPAKVHLPPGQYEVKGRSLSRSVTVPVQVTAHQVTTIHLN